MNTAPINIDRLSARIEAISRFTLPDVPWTRRAFTPLFLEARAWLKEEFARAGLVVTQDAALNLIGRREGTKAGAKPLTRLESGAVQVGYEAQAEAELRLKGEGAVVVRRGYGEKVTLHYEKEIP